MNSIPESPEEGPHLWTMNADGSDQARIEGSRLWDFAPAWSPDGELIAFVNSREKLQGFSSTVPSAIWTMTPRGENRRRLTNPSEYDFRPSWSTEGSRIVFDRDPDGNYGYACGGGITITTEKQEQEGGCPYVMGPALPSIWVMNADGSGQRRLTGELTGDSWPAFGRTR
jgi:Tol biopolymer transport system component